MKDTFYELSTEVFDYVGEKINNIAFTADEILDSLFGEYK
jgi:hypothetical protein